MLTVRTGGGGQRDERSVTGSESNQVIESTVKEDLEFETRWNPDSCRALQLFSPAVDNGLLL